MVDMYGDPAVTQELRERLPHANKNDPRQRIKEELDKLTQQEARATWSSEERQKRGLSPQDFDDNMEDQEDQNQQAQGKNRVKKNKQRGSEGDEDDEGDSRQLPNHPMFYTSPPHAGYFPPPVYTYPQVPIMFSPPLPGQQVMNHAGPAVFPVAQSSPMAGSAGHVSPSGATETNVIFPNLPGQNVNVDEKGHGTPLYGVGSVQGRTSGAASGHDAAVIREQNRQISKLLAELDATRDMMKKLQEKLRLAETELESLRLASQTQEAEIQANCSGKISDMVEEIYRAQRERDEAMTSRLRLANEERDEAMLQLRRIEQELDNMEGLDKSVEGQDLKVELSSLLTEESPGFIRKHGDVILSTLGHVRIQHNDLNREELRAVLDERDDTVNKCKQLESEVLRLQRQSRELSQMKQNVQHLQGKLSSTEHERDLSVERFKKQEEEMQTLRLYYSLHKSLSQEANLRDQFNNTVESMSGQLKQRDSQVDLAQKENNQLLAQLKSALLEKNQLQEQLQTSQLAQREASNNCQKLERLVNVLRRKLNDMGTTEED